jgi:sugar lactone lactonase YvrE
MALALNGAGDLFIADYANSRLCRVTPLGTISTVAGTGDPGYSGDDLPATQTDLGNPDGITVDGMGNMYISDQNNNRVRKISPDGIMTTIAGSGRQSVIGDGEAAIRAGIDLPAGLAVDSQGNLFLADANHGRVRKVSPDGIITTVAGSDAVLRRYQLAVDSDQSWGTWGTGALDGTGIAGKDQDGITATAAILQLPAAVAVDHVGNLFIAERYANRVRKVSPDGIITTVAGNGTAAYAGDGAPATAASLNDPVGLAMDSAGNLFIADHGNGRVRKVSPWGVISTVAGNGTNHLAGSGPRATAAGLEGPYGVAVDATGDLLIADSATFTYDPTNWPNAERVLKVSGVAAPGLIAGRPFPR